MHVRGTSRTVGPALDDDHPFRDRNQLPDGPADSDWETGNLINSLSLQSTIDSYDRLSDISLCWYNSEPAVVWLSNCLANSAAYLTGICADPGSH